MAEVKQFVFNCFNAPKGQKSPAGEHVYEWEYMDEKTGEMKKDKKNIKEMINSYLPTVDYKKQIERGELELNADMGTGTKDFTAIPDNTVDIIKYLTYISTLPQEQVTNLLEQARKGSQTNVQGTQDGTQAVTTAGQTVVQPVQTQPEVGGVGTVTNEGGTK